MIVRRSLQPDRPFAFIIGLLGIRPVWRGVPQTRPNSQPASQCPDLHTGFALSREGCIRLVHSVRFTFSFKQPKASGTRLCMRIEEKLC